MRQLVNTLSAQIHPAMIGNRDENIKQVCSKHARCNYAPNINSIPTIGEPTGIVRCSKHANNSARSCSGSVNALSLIENETRTGHIDDISKEEVKVADQREFVSGNFPVGNDIYNVLKVGAALQRMQVDRVIFNVRLMHVLYLYILIQYWCCYRPHLCIVYRSQNQRRV